MARATWLFDVTLLSPRGIAVGPLYKALGERYQFLKQPTASDFQEVGKGLRYAGGTFGSDPALEVGLQVFSDGLVADTQSSTRSAEAFLVDLVSWANRDFGLAHYDDLPIVKQYHSRLTFFAESDLLGVCDRFQAWAGLLQEFEPAGSSDRQWMSSIAYRPNADAPASFMIERRDNIAFAQNKFFSYAAMHTERHIELLERFEKSVK
jgi:hypothetical protein